MIFYNESQNLKQHLLKYLNASSTPITIEISKIARNDPLKSEEVSDTISYERKVCGPIFMVTKEERRDKMKCENPEERLERSDGVDIMKP